MNKKTKITIIISVICVALIIGIVLALLPKDSKDDDLYKNFDENEQYELEKNGASQYSSPVLVVYGQDDELIGVTQLGNKVYLDNPENISVSQGSIASKIDITVGEDGVRRGTLCYPYSTNLNMALYCPQGEAPEKMADMKIKSLMNSPGYASIRDYKINSVTEKKVDSGEEGTAIINFTVNCDMRPSEFAKVYGFPDEDGWCRNLEYDYAIWGTNETWYLLGDDPISELSGYYLDEEEQVWEETRLYADDRYVLSYACFESPHQSILTDVPLGNEDEYIEQGIDVTNLDDYEEMIELYYTELFVLDMKNGSKTIIEHGLQNFQYEHIASYNGKVYLTTKEWDSSAQAKTQDLVCYDVASMKLTPILDKGVVLAMTEDTLYAHGIDPADGTQCVCSIDIATGRINWVTEHRIPVTDRNVAVMQGVYDGYLHLMYTEYKVVFRLNEQTGEWSFGYTG